MNDNKKQHILKLYKATGFLIILTLIITLISIAYRRDNGLYVYDSLSVKVKTDDVKTEPDNSLQVIFLGDSECYASFSPKYLKSEYGYSSFVCGTAAQRICDSYAILYENFKTQSPNIIVLETNMLYRDLNDTANNDIVMNIFTKHIPVFAYHSEWKIFVRKALPKSREKNRRKNKGFIVRKGVKPYKGGKYMKKTNKTNKLDDDVVNYLDKIKLLCEENNANLILISTPSPKNWNYKKHNGVKKWADSNSITYLDLNLEDSLNINWKKDTKDAGDHLNLKGAQKVTAYIGEYFKKNYKLESLN